MYPMAVGDILDATFRLLRANAKALAPVLFLIAFPFEAIAAYNARNSESLNQLFANLGNPQQQQNATPSSVLIVGYLILLGIGLMTPVVAGFVCRTIAAFLPRRAVPVRPSNQDKPGRDTRFDRL